MISNFKFQFDFEHGVECLTGWELEIGATILPSRSLHGFCSEED
jgi:hypothetical protein